LTLLPFTFFTLPKEFCYIPSGSVKKVKGSKLKDFPFPGFGKWDKNYFFSHKYLYLLFITNILTFKTFLSPLPKSVTGSF
jgi:hypothetical protein